MIDEITIKEIKINRKTLTMEMSEKAFSIISSLFSPESGPLPMKGIHPITHKSINGYAWSLFAHSYKYEIDGESRKKYYIYGSCGDSSFGRAPSWYSSKYRGHIRVARIFYKVFLDYIIENKFKLIGTKFGI